MDKLFLGDEEVQKADKVRTVCEQRHRGVTLQALWLTAKCGMAGFTEYCDGVGTAEDSRVHQGGAQRKVFKLANSTEARCEAGGKK